MNVDRIGDARISSPASRAVAAVLILGCAAPRPARARAATPRSPAPVRSWAANAVNQWIADVAKNGLQVVFTSPARPRAGRTSPTYTTDFAVSDIGYQGTDPTTGWPDTSNGRALRLPADRRRWHVVPVPHRHRRQADQATCGCPARRSPRSSPTRSPTGTTRRSRPTTTRPQLPSLPIIPVVHSEGSGRPRSSPATWRPITRRIWNPFNRLDRSPSTSRGRATQVAAERLGRRMNFITSRPATARSGIDEYSYALAAELPGRQAARTRPATSPRRRSTTSPSR